MILFHCLSQMTKKSAVERGRLSFVVAFEPLFELNLSNWISVAVLTISPCLRDTAIAAISFFLVILCHFNVWP